LSQAMPRNSVSALDFSDTAVGHIMPLLTWRAVEVHRPNVELYKVRVGDVDHRAGRVLLLDTKNRSHHKLLLSRQALEIAKRNCVGRKADEPLERDGLA